MARGLPHDDTLRTHLVELACEAVAEGGSRALSLRRLAAAAGTTTAAIYTLFGSRDGLLDAVVDEGFRRFARHLDAAGRSEDPAADLLALGVAYRQNALANPGFYRALFGSATDGPVAEPPPVAGRPTFQVLLAAVRRLQQAAGTQREQPADGGQHAQPQASEAPDPQEVTLRLWALAHGLVSLELAGLLPGTPQDRDRRYVAALRASRP